MDQEDSYRSHFDAELGQEDAGIALLKLGDLPFAHEDLRLLGSPA